MIIPQANVLVIGAFGGMSPRPSPYLIEDTAAADSVNCNMLRGNLEPLKANEFIKRKPGKKGLIAYDKGKFITLGKPNDGYVHVGARVIFTDDDGAGNSIPMYVAAATYDDDAPSPAKYKFGTLPNLIADWVESPIEASRTQGTPAGINYYYAVTVVNRYGDESSLSWPTTEEGAEGVTTIQLSISAANMDSLRALLDGHETNGMKIRVYRSTLGTYLQIHEEDLPASGGFMWLDVRNETQDLVGSKLLEGINTKLPDNVSGFIWHPNGFLACHDDEFVYFSSPLSISLFPETSRIEPRGGKIIGLEEYGNRVLVFFENGPPKTMDISVPGPGNVRIYSPEIAHRTVSALSVSKSADGVIYASRDGVVVTDGVRSRLLDRLFDADSFDRYAPQDIRGFATDLDYFLFGAGRENLFLQRKMYLTRLSETIIDMSQYANNVYCLTENGEIHEMFANSENRYRECRWRSKKFVFHRPTLLKAAKMHADYNRRGGNTIAGGLGLPEQLGSILLGEFNSVVVAQTEPAKLTLRVIKDDTSFEVRDIETKYAWAFEERYGGRKSTSYQLEITTNTPVYSLGLAPNIRTFDAVQIPTGDNVAAGEYV